MQERMETNTSDKEWHCAVCQTSADPVAFRKLGCGHAFHGNCIAEWALHNVDASCPTCRNPLGNSFRFPEQWALQRLEQLNPQRQCLEDGCHRKSITMNEWRCEYHSTQRAELERVGLMGITNDVAGHTLLACRGLYPDTPFEDHQSAWLATAADITAKAFLHTDKPLNTMRLVMERLPKPFAARSEETKMAYETVGWDWPCQ